MGLVCLLPGSWVVAANYSHVGQMGSFGRMQAPNSDALSLHHIHSLALLGVPPCYVPTSVLPCTPHSTQVFTSPLPQPCLVILPCHLPASYLAWHSLTFPKRSFWILPSAAVWVLSLDAVCSDVLLTCPIPIPYKCLSLWL